MFIYQELSKIFKYKILSNDKIPQYLKALAEAGKFDQPKTNAVLTMILVRLAEIEDMLDGENYVESIKGTLDLDTISNLYNETETVETPQQPPVQETGETPPQVGETQSKAPKDMDWLELRSFAKSLGINTSGLKRPQLVEVVNQKLIQQ